MVENEVKVPCTACGGLGEIPLNGAYAETYGEVARRGMATASMLALGSELTSAAMANRLHWLESKGLLVSQKWGRQRQYRLSGRGDECA